MMDLNKKRKLLVNELKREGRLTSDNIAQAFLNISREHFIPPSLKQAAYEDRPLQIGHNQTISAPHMVAIMVEELDIHPGQKILEIGSGSGYHAAIISKLIGKNGHVYSIERIPALATSAKNNLKKSNISNVTIICSDGSLGYEQKAPFDRIYVTCASPKIPDPLLHQLKNGGKLLIPIGDRFCTLQRITMKEGTMQTEHICGCAFVPLIGKYGL